MDIKQLSLNRDVIEQRKKEKSISNDEKVDLDYLATYWENIITMIEKEVEKKPKIRSVAFRLVIEW